MSDIVAVVNSSEKKDTEATEAIQTTESVEESTCSKCWPLKSDVQEIKDVVKEVKDDVKEVKNDVKEIKDDVKEIKEANKEKEIKEISPKESLVVEKKQASLSTILSVCGKACAVLDDEEINKTNIIPVVHAVMESVETIKDLVKMTGEDKKQLALDCLNWLVNNHCSLPEIEKSELLFLINQIAPPAIDTIIKVANGLSRLVATLFPSCCRLS